MRLKDKVSIITGSGSGIGKATAIKFAEEGSKVVIADIVIENAEKVCEYIQNNIGREALSLKVDVCNSSSVSEMVGTVLKKFGRIDILVNNAGINRDALTKKMREEEWDEVINVNLKGTFLCAKSVIEPMIAQNYGRIINTSSVGALGNIGQANYSASKSGVIGLTKTLALELARYNITVNCVAPGATRTPMIEKLPPEIAEKFKQKIPLKRFAEPIEIANLHTFLASDDASYITGQVIFIDGGLSVGF